MGGLLLSANIFLHIQGTDSLALVVLLLLLKVLLNELLQNLLRFWLDGRGLRADLARNGL